MRSTARTGLATWVESWPGGRQIRRIGPESEVEAGGKTRAALYAEHVRAWRRARLKFSRRMMTDPVPVPEPVITPAIGSHTFDALAAELPRPPDPIVVTLNAPHGPTVAGATLAA